MEISVTSPFPFEALPRLWSWISTFKSKISDDFGPQTLEQFMQFASEKWAHQKTWAISVDGELGGLITFQKLTPWVGTLHLLCKPEFQGRGIAAKALRIAIAAMFAEGVGKLAVYPLAGNWAMGSLLTSLGFHREGFLIEQTLVGGQPADMWVYGLTKLRFEELQRNAFGSSNTRTDRSGSVDIRLAALGKAEDQHQHDHADAHPADAGDHEPASVLRAGSDGERRRAGGDAAEK